MVGIMIGSFVVYHGFGPVPPGSLPVVSHELNPTQQSNDVYTNSLQLSLKQGRPIHKMTLVTRRPVLVGPIYEHIHRSGKSVHRVCLPLEPPYRPCIG